ncbi:hypothetical protein D1AOALGA4SA_2032 [Olavius algarvensis Delta 1 endosymbiont]|nr:hypothetical protein D1AOALGA4SA_2032 [Olavius algarvensis Delta 1 endosymbiont]
MAGSGFKVQGSRFRGSRFRDPEVQGSGGQSFWVQGSTRPLVKKTADRSKKKLSKSE